MLHLTGLNHTLTLGKGVEGRTLHLHVDWRPKKQGMVIPPGDTDIQLGKACLLAAKQDGIKEMSTTALSNYPILFSGSGATDFLRSEA